MATRTPRHAPHHCPSIASLVIPRSHLPGSPQRSPAFLPPVVPQSLHRVPLSHHAPAFPPAASQPLTQGPHLRANGLHHEVGRLANDATLQPGAPGPHLLIATLGAHLHLKGAARREPRRGVPSAHGEPGRGEGRPAQASPAPDVLATPRDGDGVGAGDRGVILEAVDAIPQVLLFHALFALCQGQGRASGCRPAAARGRQHPPRLQANLLGPFTTTFSSPLPAPFVYTLKSATSFTRTPLGCRPRPTARQAPGLQAVNGGLAELLGAGAWPTLPCLPRGRARPSGRTGGRGMCEEDPEGTVTLGPAVQAGRGRPPPTCSVRPRPRPPPGPPLPAPRARQIQVPWTLWAEQRAAGF